MVVKGGEIWGSFTQKEPYIYAKRALSELPGATLAAPVISGAAFFRATARGMETEQEIVQKWRSGASEPTPVS